MAKLVDTYVCDPWDYDQTRDENIAVEDKWFDDLKRMLKTCYPGEYVGEILKWQRADGYAVYAVVRENPLEIAWIDHGDGYRVEDALIRGLIMEDVKDMVERERRWKVMLVPNEKKKEILKANGLL